MSRYQALLMEQVGLNLLAIGFFGTLLKLHVYGRPIYLAFIGASMFIIMMWILRSARKKGIIV